MRMTTITGLSQERPRLLSALVMLPWRASVLVSGNSYAIGGATQAQLQGGRICACYVVVLGMDEDAVWL